MITKKNVVIFRDPINRSFSLQSLGNGKYILNFFSRFNLWLQTLPLFQSSTAQMKELDCFCWGFQYYSSLNLLLLLLWCFWGLFIYLFSLFCFVLASLYCSCDYFVPCIFFLLLHSIPPALVVTVVVLLFIILFRSFSLTIDFILALLFFLYFFFSLLFPSSPYFSYSYCL